MFYTANIVIIYDTAFKMKIFFSEKRPGVYSPGLFILKIS